MMYVLIKDGEVRIPDTLELLGYTFIVDKVRYFMSVEQTRYGKNERAVLRGTTTKL